MPSTAKQAVIDEFAFGLCARTADKTKFGLKGNLSLLMIDPADTSGIDDIATSLAAMMRENCADFEGYRLHHINFDDAHPLDNTHAFPQPLLEAAPELALAMQDIKQEDFVRDVAFVHGLPRENAKTKHPGSERGDVYDNINMFRERIFGQYPVLWVFVLAKEEFTDFARQVPDTCHWIANKTFLPPE